MVHRVAMIPVTDGTNNLEHCTARRRRVRYLQWRNQRPTLDAILSLHSYCSTDRFLADKSKW